MAVEFNWSDFFAIGFSHHVEILAKAKSLEARLFYIHESATRFWNKYTLRDYLKSDLYSHRGSLPNNFTSTIPSVQQALKAVNTFKDEYLLDFINIEELSEQSEDLNERVVEKAIVDNVKKPHENPAIGIVLCRDMNQSFVEFAIRDYDKPMGVATYRATKDMPERFRSALPDIEELKKLL